MKLEFTGWSRTVFKHKHNVQPVSQKGGFRPEGDGPIKWHKPLCAAGKLDGLSLSGDFLVQIEFEEAELRSWLLAYSKGSPEAALRLISEAQAEAIIALKEGN